MTDGGSFGRDNIEVRPDGLIAGGDDRLAGQGGRRAPAPESPISAEVVPLPLAARSRIAWRLGSLVLCLFQCRANSATVEQLHILTWSLQSKGNYDELMRYWIGSVVGRKLRVWNADLEDTLKLALAGGVIDLSGSGRQTLTAVGVRLAEELSMPNSEAFELERRQLRELGRISTAGMMRRLSDVGVQEVPGS